MEFLKNYEFGLNYHLRKANVMADTLSRKSLHASWMMVKEDELITIFRDLNLGVVLTPYSLRLNQLKVASDFKSQIAQAQCEEEDFLKTLALVEEGKLKGFARGTDGLWRFEGRVCVPTSGDLRRRILEEAHKSHFTIHPGVTKMYQDVKKMFWWQGLKKDITELVSKCLVCQKVKIEHQKPSSMLQPLEIPEWK